YAGTELSEQSFGICVYGEDLNSSVDDQEELMELSIYPNPSEDGVFYLRNAENVEEITIYDVALKQVEHKTNSVEVIDLSKHNSGVYFVRCTSTSGNEVIRKVVKR
ncbi:MAG: T9SS type A sorting domain-containing protein, partial [Flavobacteriales bacterium]|nr:T9SS type A sorting domain-containing protein [Flavobacteriales bacterium]